MVPEDEEDLAEILEVAKAVLRGARRESDEPENRLLRAVHRLRDRMGPVW